MVKILLAEYRRRCCCLLSALTLAVAVPSLSFAQEPYLAEVAVPSAAVYSGPGARYYETTRLPQGTAVEIHRRAEKGWLAIRPTANCFSWVLAEFVERRNDGSLGEVVTDEAVSWIGGELADPPDHNWQVQLKRGEILEILGHEQISVHEGAPAASYLKVSPPSGEFRWIRATDVLVASPTKAQTESPIQLSDFRVVIEDENKQPRRDGFVARKSRAREPFTVRAQRVREEPSSKEATARHDRLGDSEFEARLKDLDLQLALMVSRPPETWDLAPLRSAIETLAERADSTVQRGRSKVLLDKLADVEGLYRRHALMRDSLEPAPRPTATTTTATEPAEFSPRFDGTGWLLPVHSSKQDSPPYALLDAEGHILQFVSPAPGLNLHRYIRKEIGIFGQKDFLQHLQKGHLTAHRIVSLDRHRR